MKTAQVLEQLDIIRKALHTGQVSATKVDAQRAFLDVEQFVKDVLCIVALTQAQRPDVGSHFAFSVSGSGESWGAFVGEEISLNERSSSRRFEEALREAGERSRQLMLEWFAEGADENAPSR